MPDLSNIPGFTELAGISDLPSFPTQADSWNAAEDASSKKTSNIAYTVSGVDVELNSSFGQWQHVMRGQGGIKGNNKIIALSYFRSSNTYSGLNNAYQYGTQAHVFTINTSTGALTCSTTNVQNVSGSNSQTGYQGFQASFYDAPGTGFLMGPGDGPLSPNTNGRDYATYMRQFDTTFSNVALALAYDGSGGTSGGGLHQNSTGAVLPYEKSICVPLTSNDSTGGAFCRYASSTDSIERAYPNGAEVSYSTNSGIWLGGYARYAYGYGIYYQPDAPLCGANDFHSVMGGYSSTSSNYKCVQTSGDGSYYETPNSTNYNDMWTGMATGFQRSGSTHTLYMRPFQGNRAGDVIPMTAYDTNIMTATAKSWTMPRYGREKMGHSCVGIGSNRFISSMKENTDFFGYYSNQQYGWPLIQWELDDTNGITITGAVNIPKLAFGNGNPIRNTHQIDTAVTDGQWAFPIWTNANDAEPSWLIVVFYRPGYNYGYQPIVKSYPWPTFKSLNISL